MHTEKIAISQKGKHKCLICEREFEWYLEVITLPSVVFGSGYSVTPTQVKAEPQHRVFFNTIGTDKIEVNIGCPYCNTVHRTEPLDKI